MNKVLIVTALATFTSVAVAEFDSIYLDVGGG